MIRVGYTKDNRPSRPDRSNLGLNPEACRSVWVKNFEQAQDLVPHAVVQLAFDQGMSPAKAWRTHLQLTQTEVARRMDVSQSAYAQLEAKPNLRKTSRERIAAALGISPGQLDF